MERTVVFLDILGFRNLVDEMTTEELGGKFSRVISTVLMSMNRPFMAPGTEPTLFPGHPVEQPWCLSYAFSDSIILISHDDSEKACLAVLVYALRSMQYLIASGLPVRGGAAFGEMHVDEAKSLFLGKALTAAYELEQKQNWIGVALDISVDAKFCHMFLKSPMSELFPLYEVPMKSGPIKWLRTLNWRWNLVVQKGTKSLFKDNGDWSVRTKIENTLNYAKFIRLKGLAYPIDDTVMPVEVRCMYIADSPPETGVKHGDEF